MGRGTEPLNRKPQPILQLNPRLKTHQLFGPVHVQVAGPLAIGLGGIPNRLPLETGEPFDRFSDPP